MKRFVVLAFGLLTACAQPSGPRILWTAGGRPAIALATVRTARGSRILAVDPEGGSVWLSPAGQAEPGPRLAPGLVRLIATDLDGDGSDELIGAAAGKVTAWDPHGRARWSYPTPQARVHDLVPSADGRTLLLLATPPVSVTAINAAGQRLWKDPLARTAYSAAAWQGGWLVALDTRLLQRYDATGRPAGNWRPALPADPREVVPTAIGAAGARVAVLGWTETDRVALVWALLDDAGRAVTGGLGGTQPLVGRDRVLAGDFGGATLAAVAPEAIYWLSADGLAGRSATGGEPVLTSAVGPPNAAGKTPLLLGTSRGVTAWGW